MGDVISESSSELMTANGSSEDAPAEASVGTDTPAEEISEETAAPTETAAEPEPAADEAPVEEPKKDDMSSAPSE